MYNLDTPLSKSWAPRFLTNRRPLVMFSSQTTVKFVTLVQLIYGTLQLAVCLLTNSYQPDMCNTRKPVLE